MDVGPEGAVAAPLEEDVVHVARHGLEEEETEDYEADNGVVVVYLQVIPLISLQ